MTRQWIITDEQHMLGLGAALSKVVQPGDIIFLKGELGVGKTTLVRGFLRAWRYQGIVNSPTYTLMEVYEKGVLDSFLAIANVCHADFYRFMDDNELENTGFTELLGQEFIF